MYLLNKKLNEGETIVSKARFSNSRNIPLIIGIVIFFGTFVYSYLWSSKWHENVWEGVSLGYFQPFFIGVSIFLLLLAFHILFANCKLILTNKRIFGKAELIGSISIPFGVIDSVYNTNNTIYVVVNKTNYKFGFVSNVEEVVTNIKNQIPQTKSNENVISANSYAKKTLLILGGIALAIILFVCSEEGLFRSSSSSSNSKSWSELNEVEKRNAEWAHNAKKAIDKYEK